MEPAVPTPAATTMHPTTPEFLEFRARRRDCAPIGLREAACCLLEAAAGEL
jgi:hypothetical protein